MRSSWRAGRPEVGMVGAGRRSMEDDPWTARRVATVGVMAGRKLPSGELENQVLGVLWSSAEPMTPGAVHAVVAADRPLAYTTVMTTLTRLWEKGELTRRRVGRAYAYVPVVSRERRIAQRMQEVLGAAEDHALALNAFADALPADQRAALRRALGRSGTER